MKKTDQKEPPTLWEQHLARFGVEPVVTGINAFDPNRTTKGIIGALQSGTPYVEDEPPQNAVV